MQTGTTTVAVLCKEAAVLAADRRATMGYMIAGKDVMKVCQIDDTKAMTIAGVVGDAQKLVRWMKAELSLYKTRYNKPATVKAASSLLANILSNYKFYPFFVQIIVGGYDSKSRVFSIDMGGGLGELTDYFSTGSGSPFALGVLESGYKDSMTLKDAQHLALNAIYTAQKRDIASGNGVTLVTITKDNYKEEVYDRDKLKDLLK